MRFTLLSLASRPAKVETPRGPVVRPPLTRPPAPDERAEEREMIELQKVYVVMKILDDMKFSWFHGFDKNTGNPIWTEAIQLAYTWENKLHAEAQAMLFVGQGMLGVQKKAIPFTVATEAAR
jgi:hypothetical protein